MSMECRDVLERISDYLDLDPEQQQDLAERLETHLADCPNCRVYVDTVRKTISLYRSETPPECPEQVRLRLHAVLSYEYEHRK
jgi:predicted anti-sigma-YlaC factor YlaD